MCDRGQKEQKWSLDRVLNLTGIVCTLISILQFLIGNGISQRKFNMFWLCLMILVAFMIGSWRHIWHEKRKEYKNNIEQLKKLFEANELTFFPYIYWHFEFMKEYFRELVKSILEKNKRSLFLVVAIIVTCICFPQNVQAFFYGVLDVEEKNDTPNIVETDKRELKELAPEEPVREERDMRWRFVLDEPTYSFVLDTPMEEQVFFYNNKEFTEWVIYVQETAKQWKTEQKEGVNYRTTRDNVGNDFFDYTNSEDNFKAEVDYASQYMYYDEWLEYAPHSSEYDKCIAGRETLNKIEVDGAIGCYEIWWKLANDYLYCAQEYERQTEDADAVLFYYTNSIYCCIEALKYSIDEQEYNRTYHFMVMRYHDICRDKCIISKEYKTIANDIYFILVEMDVLRTAR